MYVSALVVGVGSHHSIVRLDCCELQCIPAVVIYAYSKQVRGWIEAGTVVVYKKTYSSGFY